MPERPSVCGTLLQSSSQLRERVLHSKGVLHIVPQCVRSFFFLFLGLQQRSFAVLLFCFFWLLVYGYILISSLVWYAPFYLQEKRRKYKHWHCLSRHDGCWPHWYCRGGIYSSLKWKRSSFICLCGSGWRRKNDDLRVSCRSLQLLGLRRRQVDRGELRY